MSKLNFTQEAFPNFEAEVKIWNKFDTEIAIEFSKDKTFSEEEKEAFLKKIEEKIEWIEANKNLILDTFIEEEGMFEGLNDEIRSEIKKKGIAKFYNDLVFEEEISEETFKDAIGVRYLNFFVDEEISCDFDLDAEPDYFFGHLANIELEEDNEIIMGGING